MSALHTRLPTLPWTAPQDQPFELQSPDVPFMDELFQTRSLVGRRGNTISLDVYIPPVEGELLYSLVRHLCPDVSLEIGLANGVSALYIAKALLDNGRGRHLAIDPFQSSNWDEAGLVTLERSGLDSIVSLDPRPSHWALPDLEKQGLRVQFAFVDGSHLFDYVMTDFLGVDRLLDVGGLVAFDDSDWPSISNVIRFALTNRDYEVFDTTVVVEPSPIRPRLLSRGLRSVASKLPSLRRILRHEFNLPAHELGIAGRCVVLRKLADDRRDSQSQSFIRFS